MGVGGVSLSIKDVPDALAERLRQRAARNHRSLQRELMAIVEAAAEPDFGVAQRHGEGVGTATEPVAAARESEGAYTVAVAGASPGFTDDLLSELDTIVAGSRWGSAPLLSREQAHDRALAREFDFEARSAELADARRRQRHGGAA